jgi:hypothetical protein
VKPLIEETDQLKRFCRQRELARNRFALLAGALEAHGKASLLAGNRRKIMEHASAVSIYRAEAGAWSYMATSSLQFAFPV